MNDQNEQSIGGHGWWRGKFLLVVVGMILGVSGLWAQNDEAAGEADPDSPALVRERSLYIPYEDLEAVFEEEGRGVFLPYREFLDLWNELQRNREEGGEGGSADRRGAVLGEVHGDGGGRRPGGGRGADGGIPEGRLGGFAPAKRGDACGRGGDWGCFADDREGGARADPAQARTL